MPNGIKTNIKLFAHDTHIFNIVQNKNNRAKDLTHDLLYSQNRFLSK